MKKVTDFLEGKKTFIGIAVGVIYSIAIYFGVVESNELVWTAVVGWTGVSFKLGK